MSDVNQRSALSYQRWTPVYNDTDEVVPAHALMWPTGGKEFKNGQQVYTIQKPGENAVRYQEAFSFLVNGATPIPKRQYGAGTQSFPTPMLTESLFGVNPADIVVPDYLPQSASFNQQTTFGNYRLGPRAGYWAASLYGTSYMIGSRIQAPMRITKSGVSPYPYCTYEHVFPAYTQPTWVESVRSVDEASLEHMQVVPGPDAVEYMTITTPVDGYYTATISGVGTATGAFGFAIGMYLYGGPPSINASTYNTQYGVDFYRSITSSSDEDPYYYMTFYPTSPYGSYTGRWYVSSSMVPMVFYHYAGQKVGLYCYGQASAMKVYDMTFTVAHLSNFAGAITQDAGRVV